MVGTEPAPRRLAAPRAVAPGRQRPAAEAGSPSRLATSRVCHDRSSQDRARAVPVSLDLARQMVRRGNRRVGPHDEVTEGAHRLSGPTERMPRLPPCAQVTPTRSAPPRRAGRRDARPPSRARPRRRCSSSGRACPVSSRDASGERRRRGRARSGRASSGWTSRPRLRCDHIVGRDDGMEQRRTA